MAREIVRHHGAVVWAAVSPYRAVRNEARNFIGADIENYGFPDSLEGKPALDIVHV